MQTDKTADALKEFFNELNGILQAGARRRARARQELRLAALPRRVRNDRATSHAGSRTLLVYHLPDDYFAKYVQNIQAVTAADVQRVAQKYIQPDRLAVVVVGDLDDDCAPVRALNLGDVKTSKSTTYSAECSDIHENAGDGRNHARSRRPVAHSRGLSAGLAGHRACSLRPRAGYRSRSRRTETIAATSVLYRRCAMRRCVPIICACVAIALLQSVHAQTPVGQARRVAPATATTLPVRRVVLYKNGVGYFEHVGRVIGNQSVSIDFNSAQLNDALKSMTVLDLGGGRIADVSFNSETPLAVRLGALPLPANAGTTLADLLGALRGARLEVTSGGHTIVGRLLSVEQRPRTKDDAAPKDQLTIVSDGGEIPHGGDHARGHREARRTRVEHAGERVSGAPRVLARAGPPTRDHLRARHRRA